MSDKNKDAYWKNQVEEFCRIFGLTVNVKHCLFAKNEMFLKYGKSTVSVPSKEWSSGFDMFRIKYENNKETHAYKEMMQKLSGKTLVWRWTEKSTPVPLGFIKNRHERVLKLPEFGSVEELKLKLMALGMEF